MADANEVLTRASGGWDVRIEGVDHVVRPQQRQMAQTICDVLRLGTEGNTLEDLGSLDVRIGEAQVYVCGHHTRAGVAERLEQIAAALRIELAKSLRY
ncbi:MAG: hypothetical protein ACRELB_01820 [Polyangiaceae bacterium]